jgi:hypothetical protein
MARKQQPRIFYHKVRGTQVVIIIMGTYSGNNPKGGWEGVTGKVGASDPDETVGASDPVNDMIVGLGDGL